MDPRDYYRLVDLLKHIDMCTSDILGGAHFVSLYTLDEITGRWIDIEIQGEFVVCSRNEEPRLVFYILNHVQRQKFVEPILEEMGWELVPPMFLYKKDGKVFNIDFQDQEEYFTITALIKDAIKSMNLKPAVQPRKQAIQNFGKIAEAQQNFQEIAGMLDAELQEAEQSKSKNASTSKISAEDPLEGTSRDYPNVPMMDEEELEVLTSAMSLQDNASESEQPKQKPSSVLPEKPKSGDDKAKDSKQPEKDEADILKMLEPLNQKQVVQTLIWLLKNDSEFVKKIYDAYIKSFMKWL